MNEKQSGEIVKQILGSYPAQRQRMTDDDVAGMTITWVATLVGIDHALAIAARDRLIRTCKFMPTLAEFMLAVGASASGPAKPGAIAWGEVRKLIHRYGAYRTPGVDFEVGDAQTAQAIAAFGWTELCASEAPVADRARFIELYDRLTVDTRTEAIVSGQLGFGFAIAAPTPPERKQIGEAVSIVALLAEAAKRGNPT